MRASRTPERARIRSADWPPFVVLALFVAFAFVVYTPALSGGKLWDDDQYLTKPELRSLTGLARIWTEIGATPQYYPLTYSAFWFQHALWGETLTAYHALNVVLHAVNAFLVWRILQRLAVPGALLAAAVFLAHPVMVESVAWITELKNTLSGACYLGALALYLRFDPLEREDGEASGSESRDRRAWIFYSASLAAFACAVLAKSVTASLPAVVLVIAWWRTGRIGWKRNVLPLVPFFALAMALGALTVWMETHVVGAKGEEYALGALARGLLACRVVCFYLGKLFWPVDLTFIYPRWEVDASAPAQWIYPILCAALLASAWIARRRFGRAPLAALFFFAGTLFPVLGFVNVFPFRYSYVADHFQYLAALGPIALACAGIERASAHLRERWMGRALQAVLVIGLAAMSRRQAAEYTDVEVLWKKTIERNPACWMAHTNYGVLRSDKGDWSEARASFERALAIRADLVDARENLGRALDRLGQHEQAIAEFERALADDPDAYKVHNTLGSSLLALGRTDMAIAHFERAIAIEPRFTHAHFNLGLACVARGDIPRAIASYEQALALYPEFADAHNNLGTALARQGDFAGAIAHLERALAIQPSLENARKNLERARAAQKQSAPER